VGWWLFVTCGGIFLGTIGYLEKILNFNLSIKLRIIFLVMFLLFSGLSLYRQYDAANHAALIKTMGAAVSVTLEAEWKDGGIPNPGKMIFTGGAPKSLEVTFELLNGDHKVVEFFGVNGLNIHTTGNKTIFGYHSVSTQSNLVFEMKPSNIIAITQIGFATFGLKQSSISSPEIRFSKLDVQFFINGEKSFNCEINMDERLDMSSKSKNVDEIWIWKQRIKL
jgi:hypothetical protein